MSPDVLTRPCWPIICAALAVTLVLAACSGGPSRSASESDPPVPSQSASQAPDDAGREVIIVTRAPGGEISSSVKLVPSGERLDGFMDKERSQPNVIGVMPNATGELQSSPPDDSAYSKGDKKESKYMPNVGACCSVDVMAAGKGYPGAGTATGFVDGWDVSGGGVWLDGAPLGDVMAKIKEGKKTWGDVVRPKIAILDSGIEPLDPELSGPKRPWKAIGDGYDFSGGGDPVRLTMESPLPQGAKLPYDMGAASASSPTDKTVRTYRHGTKVASIIAAARNNAKTIAGLATEAPNGAAFESVAQVLPYIITKPVVDQEPVADLNYVTNALGRIINDAAKAQPNPPDIVLMPFKFDSSALGGDAVKLLSGFVNDLTAAGVLVIASAARDGAAAVPPALDAVAVPAGLPNVLRVGGWGDVIPADPASKGRFPKGTPSTTSPRSPLVDVVAPAKGVVAAYRNPGFLRTGQDGFVETDGQSASAAMVAAAVALRKGVFQQQPCWKKPDAATKFGCVNALASGIRETAWKPADPTDPLTAGTAGEYFGSGMLSVPSLLAVPQTVTNADDGLDGLAMPIPQIPAGTNTTVTITDTGTEPYTDPVAPDKVTVDVKVAGLVPGLLPAVAKIKDPVSGEPIPETDFKYRVWVDGKPAAKTQAAFKNNQPNPFDPYTDFTVSGTEQALGVEAVLPTGVLKPVDLLVTLVAPGHGDSFGYHTLCRSKTDDGKKIQSLPARTAILTCSGTTQQTVQFTSRPAPGVTKVGDTYTPAATASSGLAVAYGIDPASAGVCELDAATRTVVTFKAKGKCVITADQAGDQTFVPASARQPVDVGSQTVTFNPQPPANGVVDGTFRPAATATSNLPVTFSIDRRSAQFCEIDGAGVVVTFKAKGWCWISADQAGDAQWMASYERATVTVVGKQQTVTFNPPPPVDPVAGSTFRPAATATSGLPVTYGIDPASASACKIDGTGLVTFKAKGTCVINADQAGDNQWEPAPTMAVTINVVKKP